MYAHTHSQPVFQTDRLSVYPVSSRNYLVAIKAKIMFTSDVPLLNPFDAHCCHMATAIRHHVPDRVKVSFVILTYKHSDDKSAWMSKIPNDSWHRMLYSCTNMATIGVKGLTIKLPTEQWQSVTTTWQNAGNWPSRMSGSASLSCTDCLALSDIGWNDKLESSFVNSSCCSLPRPSADTPPSSL